MNLILLFPDDFITDTRVRLEGRRLTHVLEVHRAAPGDELCVGLLNGGIGTGTVIQPGPTILELEVRFERQPPRPLPATVVLALPRPKVLRRVLRAATVLGVKRIVLLNAGRVEKSYWQSPFLEPGAVREQLVLGLEQAKDTLLPEVLLRPLFKPFVEDELPGLASGTIPLAAHPSAALPCPRGVDRPVTLAVGPEGGFTAYEIDKFLSCGFAAVSLGERVLNVETAVPTLLSRLF